MISKRLTPLLVLVVTGCLFGGDPNIDGRWVGNTMGIAFNVELTEEEHRVTGSGSLTDAVGSVAVTVLGTHAHPAVSLTFQFIGFEPTQFTGVFETDNLITGTLSGSGLDGQLSLVRDRT